MIRKTSGKDEWKIYSDAKDDEGKRKLLGSYKSKAAAEKRLAQIEQLKNIPARRKRGR